MAAKEILDLEMVDPQSHIKCSIGTYIRDVIDGMLCEEIFAELCEKRGLYTEEAIVNYAFYDDPIWKKAWNKKVNEIANALKL